MIFNDIELQNFRQYKGPTKIVFSDPNKDKNNITLIIAANGVGKTTLLQAFRYCFYGQKSAFLVLPNRDELVNNTLVEEMKDTDVAEMKVSVTFTHKSKRYLAVRRQKFLKIKGRLSQQGEETFTLSTLTEYDGWKEFTSVDAQEKIQSILPDGLSQIFMFDGERMERNFADKKFGEELRESILGILDIKKYDKLYQIIGNENRSFSVLGMLNKKIVGPTKKDQESLDNYNQILTKQKDMQDAIEKINEEISEIDQKLEDTKAIQKQLDENKERVLEREKADNNYIQSEKQLEQLSNDYLKKAKEALVYKLLLQVKNDYESFINQGHNRDFFYEYLHVNTIEDIIEKGICVCGRPVKEHSEEELRLIQLKKVSLPIESAQNLNLISQKIKKSVEFQDLMEELKVIKNDMSTEKGKMHSFRETSNKLNKEIQQTELKYGKVDYKKYEDLNKAKYEKSLLLGEKQHALKLLESGLERGKSARMRIESSNQENINVRDVINTIHEIKSDLYEFRRQKDENARKILAKNFDKIIQKTLQGKYSTYIDERYKITIKNLNTGIDETSILSTGQNIIVSLAFVNALIETAKELSQSIDINEKYGVIMDAALSNLDERHIHRVSRININGLDQLIFMSFKKQLRDEMYNGIKGNIGRAYYLTRNEKGHVVGQELAINQLDAFIHEYEEDEDE